MALLVIIILGLIQGATEFLPVSSSGHVLIFSRLFGQPSSFEFDVLVSFGTLLAVIIYYRQRILSIIRDLVVRRDLRLILCLALSTLPAVAVGFFLQDLIERYLHSSLTAVIMLLGIGILMVISRRWQPRADLPVNKDLRQVSYRQALLIGAAQTVSLISGSSRSGVTMLAAIRLGFNTKVAAEWSFLMSIPVILGAAVRVLLTSDGLHFVRSNTVEFAVANLVSFASGLLAIHVLLKILQRYGLYWFGWYRIALGVVLLILISVKIL